MLDEIDGGFRVFVVEAKAAHVLSAHQLLAALVLTDGPHSAWEVILNGALQPLSGVVRGNVVALQECVCGDATVLLKEEEDCFTLFCHKIILLLVDLLEYSMELSRN
jgi:hypothetical protein